MKETPDLASNEDVDRTLAFAALRGRDFALIRAVMDESKMEKIAVPS